MTKVGIICEFNPIHAGHIYLFDKVRERFGSECAVICIMSGNFTQRGMPAIYPKYKRAKSAVLCGCDAVYELPFPWCAAPAPFFAAGGVAVAKNLGCEYLAFGSESGDIEYLSEVRDNLDSEAFRDCLLSKTERAKHTNKSGINLLNISYKEYFGEALPVGANNTLALEYLSAINKIAPEIKPFTVRRYGIASAGATRGEILQGDYHSVPEKAAKVLKGEKRVDYSTYDLLSFAFMREHAQRELNRFGDGKGGFAEKLFAKAKSGATPQEFFEGIADKRTTNARVRRFILSCICSVTPQMWERIPEYTVLLAMNKRGREALIKKDGFAIITKPSRYDKLSDADKAIYERSIKADSLYGLCCEISADDMQRETPYIEA